jgi:hypothetical protein
MVAPVGAVQVAIVSGTAVVHPTKEQLKASALRLVVAGTVGVVHLSYFRHEFVGVARCATFPIRSIS